MSAIHEILADTISKLSQNITNTQFLNHIICEMTTFIENEKFYQLQQYQEEEVVSTNIPQNIEEKSANVSTQAVIEEPQKKVDVIKTPTFSDVLRKDLPPSPISTQSVVSSNSVTSTNSSRDSEQQYFINGINDASDETRENMAKNSEMRDNIDGIVSKNKIINNTDNFINSMLDCEIPMWKVMFYFYMSNKQYDISASTSKEDSRQNDKKIDILEDYSNNLLINYDESHPYHEYIEYYFNKTIEYNNGKYICKKDKEGHPIVLIFKNRFLKLINNFIKRKN
jgi:hypothetical protein